jgi:hypothetical protein
MADAPKPSGGGWTALEIIVVLILAIGLLDRISGRSAVPIAGTDDSSAAATSKLDYSDPKCGLTVVTPKAKTVVTNSVNLIGTVSGCNWSSEGTVALDAQVVDADGLPLTDYVNVPITTKTATAANFASTIAFSTPPATSTGTLILIPATRTNHTQSVAIPLIFK